jgi:membrane-associated phospholipid phosphatase
MAIFGRWVQVRAWLAVACAATANSARAQLPSAAPDSAPRLSFFTAADPWLGAAFVVGTAAMMPLDRTIARELQEPGTQASRVARRSVRLFNTIGDPGTVIIGLGMYGVGRVAHLPRIADLGLHGMEAIVISGGLTAALKGIAGRERPNSAGVEDPGDFAFGAGFRGHHTSFPSGHATAAFAAATVVTVEASRWWPGSAWYVSPVMYGGASVIGLARLYSNAHWASDVVLGAGIGTLTGLKVFRFNHAHPGNRLDRWLLEHSTFAIGGSP